VRNSPAQFVKILIALLHALIPLWVAHEIVTDNVRSESMSPALHLLLRGFFLVSIGIFTMEIMQLHLVPDRLAPVLELLVIPPALAGLNWWLFSRSSSVLLTQAGTFYLTSFLLVVGSLVVYRFAYQKTIAGWEWIPVSLAMVLLFVPTLAGVWAFWQALWQLDALSGRLAPVALVVSILMAAINEIRLVLKYHPGEFRVARPASAETEG